MKNFFKLKKLFIPTLAISGISFSSCTWNSLIDKSRISLATDRLGSLNYALEYDDNPEVLRTLVEPLMTLNTPSYIKSYLTNKEKMVLRNYKIKDNSGLLEHGIDFDPSKITKDKDGYWDITTDLGTDIVEREGSAWTSDSEHEAGAADIWVQLINEKPLYISSDNVEDSKQDSRIIRFHIRDDMKWSNGDPVTPSDYVTTLKYVLDPSKGSSLYTGVINDLQIFNASKCYNERSQLIIANPGISSDETWSRAAACQSYVMPKNDKGERISNHGFGVRDIGNNWLEVEFESGRGNLTSLAFGNQALLPINEKFVNSLPRGILDFGLKKEYFLTSGAMKLSYFRPDYKLSADKNDDYWNAENTFSSGVDLRLVPDKFSQINLFRNGYISEIFNIAPEFLPVLTSDPSIAKLISRNGGRNIVSEIIFSPSYLAANADLSAMNDPDFRRALYYGLNRVETLDAQNLFGIFPSSLSFPPTSFADFPPAANDNLYTLALKESFTPDYPGEKSYFLADIESNDRSKNKFSGFLGRYPQDNAYKPELAKKFMKRWVTKYKIRHPKLPFEFAPNDEPLALTLKNQWERLFHQFGFELDLVPQLQTTLDAKIQMGRFPSTIYRYNMQIYGGRSSFNWFMPYVTTTLSGDRRYANLTLFNGDTAGAYARRLAVTEDGIKRLKQLGFNPNTYDSDEAGNFWKILQSLDDYTTSDNPDINSLPRYGSRGDFKYTSNSFWKKPTPLEKPKDNVEYIFRTGLKVSSNGDRGYFSGNLYIQNPLYVHRDSDYGIFNASILAKFYLALEKLIRDGAFNIPINSYSSSFYANILVARTRPDPWGMTGNLVHAYRYDANLTNSNGRQLPGEEILLAAEKE